MASIIELIKNIRNARLGKDVRENIASAIEQTYEDAAKQDNANMEVVQARGTFDTLNKRLNNSDASKADKNEITTLNNTFENLIRNESNSRKEAYINLQNQINGLANGSPLISNSISEMTDTTRVYLLTTNGHWYWYNGNEWTDGGVYQSSGTADNSIIPSLTSFIKEQKNSFDVNGFIADKYWATPNELRDGTYCYYFPTPVKLKPKTTYYFYDIMFYYNFCWLSNESKTSYIKLIDAVNNNTFTTDSENIYLYITLREMLNDGLLIAEDDFSPILTKNSEYVLKNKEFYCGNNKQFKKLKDAVEYAGQFSNATLYVDSGEYDLVEEYGAEFLNNNNVKGLELKNGLKVIFMAKTKVKFHYTGTNAFIKREFSPFNTGKYGGSLENCVIECSNCRYCVHDERGGSLDSYVNTFKQCEFYIDNSKNEDWNYQEMSVAGGFGLDGIIRYENCVFDKPSYYHQNADDSQTQSKCDVYFINNVVNKGNFHVNSGHSSMPISKFFACGNITKSEIPSTGENTNVKSYLFNNAIL